MASPLSPHIARRPNSWWNHLNPAVKKGSFSEWEDAVIIKLRGWGGVFSSPDVLRAHILHPPPR